MEKITFKVAYTAPTTTPKVLELLKTDARGTVTFIDNHGARLERSPLNGESVAKLVLGSVETFDYNGEKMKRVFGVFSYLPIAESSKAATETEMTENRIHRQAHLLLKTHQQVIVRDANGNDTNPNRYGAISMFELIDETENIKNEVEKNINIVKAKNLCIELYEVSKETFIELCYAYGITNVATTEVEKLFNEAMFKIEMNPNHFLEVYEDKDRELKALINKAKSVLIEDPMNVGPKTAISEENGLYYLDGEVIADSYDKLVMYLKSNIMQKERVQRLLGITPKLQVEVKTLPASDELAYSGPQIQAAKQNQAARIKEMEKTIKFSYNKYEKDLEKNPEKRAEIEAHLLSELERKRNGFDDILDAYDAYSAKQRASYIKA